MAERSNVPEVNRPNVKPNTPAVRSSKLMETFKSILPMMNWKIQNSKGVTSDRKDTA